MKFIFNILFTFMLAEKAVKLQHISIRSFIRIYKNAKGQ